MGVLVEDLLVLARLDQQRPLEQTTVDILAIAHDAVHDARLLAPDRAIDLTVDGSLAPLVTGDEARLRQVVHNLMSNALVHTPGGSPITVAVSTDGAAEQAVLAVSDRGSGIDDADTDRVFERFYRADTSRSRQAGGNGLGLSIVAGLVAAHGGSVAVADREGGGATFAMSLPLQIDRSILQ
jgi:two-component system OmpR family sensor kinase